MMSACILVNTNGIMISTRSGVDSSCECERQKAKRSTLKRAMQGTATS